MISSPPLPARGELLCSCCLRLELNFVYCAAADLNLNHMSTSFNKP